MPAAGGGGGGDPRGQHFRPAHLTVVLRAIGVILATFALTSLCSALRDRRLEARHRLKLDRQSWSQAAQSLRGPD